MYDMVEPKEVIKAMDRNFYEMLASAKWKERKEALTGVHELVSNPKLATGDYGDLCRELKKVRACLSCLICFMVIEGTRCVFLYSRSSHVSGISK